MDEGCMVNESRNIKLADTDGAIPAHQGQLVQVWKPDVVGCIVAQISITYELVRVVSHCVLLVYGLFLGWKGLVASAPDNFQLLRCGSVRKRRRLDLHDDVELSSLST